MGFQGGQGELCVRCRAPKPEAHVLIRVQLLWWGMRREIDGSGCGRRGPSCSPLRPMGCNTHAQTSCQGAAKGMAASQGSRCEATVESDSSAHEMLGLCVRSEGFVQGSRCPGEGGSQTSSCFAKNLRLKSSSSSFLELLPPPKPNILSLSPPLAASLSRDNYSTNPLPSRRSLPAQIVDPSLSRKLRGPKSLDVCLAWCLWLSS